VVEDNPTTRKMLRLTLATDGHAVVEAADGHTALEAAEKTVLDLVLQDLILPDMDGVELLGRLRALPGGTELPVVALSGFLGHLHDARADEHGFTAVLVKPIEPSRLIGALRPYLPQPAAAASIGEGRRLLVVDDDPVQLKLTRIRFAHMGFVVTVASNASDALIAARANRPDVILSDALMPETDGFQLCLAIRRDPSLATVPIVLLSGLYGSKADQAFAQHVGANALVMRTPDLATAAAAIINALATAPPMTAEPPSDHLELRHARIVIHQLERQASTMAGLAQRCGVQTAQLSLLGGVADALMRNADIDAALRDVLAATLDAAGISKGALILKDPVGVLELRQDIGFSERERLKLRGFFGHRTLLEEIVEQGGSVSVPSPEVVDSTSRDILAGANFASAQIVPLISSGRAMGVMLIGATHTDVTTGDSVAFARAMGNQVVQSLELASSVSRLTASEQRYRTLLETANDYIAILSPDGTVREMNHRWVELTGLPHEQLIGRNVREFAPAGKEDENLRSYTEAVASGGARTAVEIATVEGSTVLIEFSRTRVDVGGEPLVFTIGRDVTEQRRLEEHARQSQKLEAVGQLAGGIAHDFNNLLTAILGFSDLMLSGMTVDDPGRADLVEIKNAGERAAGLTRQLLAFSRKQILQPTVLNINDIIAEMESMLKRLIFEDVDLGVALNPQLGLVKMDPTQLEQILVNLATNASDAMPHGGKLMIETANVTLDAQYQQRHLPVAPGEYVMLAVSDTGVGMDQATIRHIFEPFFTTKGVGHGTGLGLATVYGIVTQSGGNIWVYSEPGRGSTFKIYLPQVMPAGVGATKRVPDASAIPRGSETVLVAEDDGAVRRLAAVTLERAGYRVLQAGNPKEAMQVASEFAGPIHLLLSDVIMPESEGPPLFDRLSPVQRGLRVLYMSGYADEAVVRHGILAEGTPFLQKPFTPLALGCKVRDVLDS
jgi:PAS domain S-box-containing protein